MSNEGNYNQDQNQNQQGGYQQYNQQQGGYQQQYQPQQGYQQYSQQQYQPQQGGYQQYNQQQYQPQQGGYQQYNQQQYQPQQDGYQQYNQQGGQQNYNQGGYKKNYSQNYNQGGYQQQFQPQQSYQANNGQQSQGMSLDDYQKQQTKTAAPKVKKTLKLVSSSGIKLGNAPKKEEPKKEEPVKSTEESKAAADETTKTEESLPDVKTLKISDETPAPKKDEGVDALIKEQEDEVDAEVVNDMFGGKDHMSIIFMGHVDAGKSTMGGNLLYLTGSVDKRTVEKYEREAKDAGRQGWYLSWVMDTNKEERNDGKTIEVGRAYFETEKRRYTILDAPGHKMYVSEMIGGASQADVGILVISARKGEYETGFEKGGQTREHSLLAKTQGVSKMIVVVNKMDDPTVDWSEERYNQCVKNLSNYLKAIGYGKDDIIFMPVSGYTGAGLKEPVDPKVCPWYKGPTLLNYLDGMTHVDRHINAPFMLPISSKMKDMGTVVEGKIESGHIKKGQSTLLMPNKIAIEIQNIYNETEKEVDMAVCGEQVKLRVKGVEEEDIQPGFVMTSPKNPIKSVTRFVAQLAIVELKSIMSAGFSCVMHVHTAIEEVQITRLLHKLEKGTNRKSKKPPAFAKKGMKIIAVLETEAPVCVETYDDYPQLGRFTLRDQGTTIAIGKIVKLLD
ncbi:similar to Saccharomyces cerevisiae YDR172W SUP35 Translation termination factor eRF3, has a role in mRNA deadenylation and decay [Maudiozyma barnettii]|uniref:Eukaryotic peptide chain release factor GTP-binding subunit n=1 Tax=Maudiozyma barnettii TaxID=61262 RepID=A0A8H2VHN7_9SACH|nr:translation termination factor GTPase eRF3 [Kazachstania barnettii]CAB4255657.1 similar to Saccharomyces cerevisiae YDR172W SUP35 Translation termination factor eRF3, has a role in mRNA deadenylation and decay [Kazachstania barnettii]CAD1784218.1 similar to Saccharomyces cerevisiae YDR172W SUP35 Translation termination factor eRF3, has a role in mRNA deadenylation and decay [Kazachstania barnettii]